MGNIRGGVVKSCIGFLSLSYKFIFILIFELCKNVTKILKKPFTYFLINSVFPSNSPFALLPPLTNPILITYNLILEERIAVIPKMFSDCNDGNDQAEENEEQVDVNLVLYELQLTSFLTVELVLQLLNYVHFIILL